MYIYVLIIYYYSCDFVSFFIIIIINPLILQLLAVYHINGSLFNKWLH